jgi:hypothetical protein
MELYNRWRGLSMRLVTYEMNSINNPGVIELQALIHNFHY